MFSLESKIDNTLMFDFMKRVSLLKSIFMKFSSFEEFIENKNYVKNENQKKQLKKIILVINKILKGKYRIGNDGEKIISDNQERVYLQNASSGQQEAIRILQDIFMILLQVLKILRIIEEPEAHLFPVAQKQLIELLALMVNYQPENQLIITTHSPYILTVF